MCARNANARQEIQHLILKNQQPLIVRHAEPGDAEQLLAYFEQIANESENIGFGPGEFELSVEEERNYLQQIAATTDSCYLIAEVAGNIAGVLTFSPGKRQRTRHAGEFGITVIQKYWNLGLGNHLLTTFLAWARQTGTLRKINLRVRTDNLAAIHLYQKHGFLQEGIITRDMYLHDTFIDAYLMGLPLDPL
ncbi:GNAT family N-acetyltransferase [Dictyobacter arantiisoli]|uniref:Acetyltransferase n=1 Tax=Dictyobacter arantiisoli TaxID=2014874 RepID=A0A5A5TGW5_9CHLR|nr:GNAT family N-acetyltransferase [Dictyobacter arantiisoli]GCF10821.1 acetyltransferase [Dictyobacter arantiisoli]